MSILKKVYAKLFKKKNFPGSKKYWEERYALGGNSGSGSYDEHAEFKANIINDFVKKNDVKSVIEFGCGDGNQLLKAKYHKYIGLDVSTTAISMCIKSFAEDTTKSFYLYDQSAFVDNHNLFESDLSLSLDVIYHLVEDEVFNKYMQHLFESAKKYVIIYANDNDSTTKYHVRWRKFSKWIEKNQSHWELIDKINKEGLHNSFYFYENSKNALKN